jgi:hypothetical protein
MNGLLLGMAMLASSTATSPTPGPPYFAAAARMVSFEVQQAAPRRLRQSALLQSATAVKPRHSKVDRIIAVAAGVSIGWVVGGGIGFAVTPKRGPYDDTSGLKGMMIGAPIGAVAGALLGYRLTK